MSPPSPTRAPAAFHRTRLSWLAYLMLAWFAYLQAAPGLVIGHLRDELDLGYAVGGLHVAAFAAGSVVAGVVSAPTELLLGRRRLLWSSAVVMALGTVGLTAGRAVEVTLGSVLVMGVGGGLLLTLVQAALADHHGEHRAVALTEANVAASVAYVGLVVALAAAAVLGVDWRLALLASLVVPASLWWSNRHLPIDAAPPAAPGEGGGRLPGVYWVAAALLFCATAAEWCITAWGATYVEDATAVSTDTAVALMAGYFGGVVTGRVLGSRLTRRHDPARLLVLALATAAAGFAVLWPATTALPALAGLVLLGTGLGNLFPLGVSLAVSLAPKVAARASGRAVAVASLAVLLAPLTVGALADAASLRSALLVLPVLLVLAAAALVVVRRAVR